MSLLFFSLVLLITVSMSFICQVALLCPTSLSDGDMLETVYGILLVVSLVVVKRNETIFCETERETTRELLCCFVASMVYCFFYFCCTVFHSINR